MDDKKTVLVNIYDQTDWQELYKQDPWKEHLAEEDWLLADLGYEEDKDQTRCN